MSKLIRRVCILCMIILPSIILAQEWVARYNGPGNGADGATAMAIDDLGNIYVTGYSAGSGTDYDYATVKYNSSGVEQWVAMYNGPGHVHQVARDHATAIAVDDQGNVYVTGKSGYYDLSGGTYDYATVKYDAAGIEQWAARYNGPGIRNDDDVATAIAVDDLGNVYVTGYSEGTTTCYDYATVKYNSSGARQWVARYDGPEYLGDDRATAIAVDDQGNVYVTGESRGSGTGYDHATVMYDSSGIEQWVARYDGPANGPDGAEAIAIDDLGNVYVTGRTWDSGTDYDYATVKYDSSGNRQWVARYNGPSDRDDRANAIAVDDLGNVYVTGYSEGTVTCYDYATVKYNSSGIEQWVARYHGPGNYHDRAYAIAIDDLGNVYVTGQSRGASGYDDYATVKYDAAGVEQWVARYHGPANDDDRATALAVDDLGSIYVTGSSWGLGTDLDYATIKYSPLAVTIDNAWDGSKQPDAAREMFQDMSDIEPFPTILRGPLQLPENTGYKVFDITGRVVMPEILKPGIYFIGTDDHIIQKVIKMK